MSRTFLEFQCLRKSFPRVGTLGVLSEKEMGFQNILPKCEAAQQEQAVALTCVGSMDYLALGNMKIQAPKSITSLGLCIQVCHQRQKMQLGGDSDVPFGTCGSQDFLQTLGICLRSFFPARCWQSPAYCHQLS